MNTMQCFNIKDLICINTIVCNTSDCVYTNERNKIYIQTLYVNFISLNRTKFYGIAPKNLGLIFYTQFNENFIS